MNLNNVTSLHLRTMRPGESYTDYVKRMRGADAVAQLNRTFEEKRHEIALEDARRESYDAGAHAGHLQGYWWGLCCGVCLASVGGALAVVAWAWLHRGGA